MAVRTLLWRGLDEPRMEIAHVEGRSRAHGTQIGIAYELRWNLDGAVLELTKDGAPVTRIELGGADFFDVQHSASEADIAFDADGFVTLYHDYLERVV